MDKREIFEILNKNYFSKECHEKELIETLPGLLGDAGVFVDVGASLGQYTYHANRALRNGRIYAIEADPVRYEELEKNCAKWQAESTNIITPVHAAASAGDGEISFFVTDSNVSGGLFVRGDTPASKLNWREVTVKSLSLDSLFAEDPPDFIKIDVEGAELKVLSGAVGILKKSRTRFLIEVHNFPDSVNPKEVYKFMERFGYSAKNYFGRKYFVKREKRLRRLYDFLKGK